VSRSFQNRCLVVCALLVAGLSVLSFRVIHIQLVQRETLAKHCHKAYVRREVLRAQRGMILDRNEEPLAQSVRLWDVIVDWTHMLDPSLVSRALAAIEARESPEWAELNEKKRRNLVNTLRADILATRTADEIVRAHRIRAVDLLAEPLGMSRAELDQLMVAPGPDEAKWRRIKTRIPEEAAERIRSLIDRHALEGFAFENTLRRNYFSPTLATHLTGYTGEIEETDENGKKIYRMVGKFGVEGAMEEFLAGRDGWRIHRRSPSGLLLPGDATSLLPPRAGFNVKLTVDMGVQTIVEEELDAALAEYLAPRGAVVVMNPKTGEVLAMASRPHPDLSRLDDLDKTNYNFALQAIYEPGSTFKVVAAAGALNEGLVTLQTPVFCHHGYYSSGNLEIKDVHPYPTMPLEQVIAKSSNIGTHKIALKLGAKKFYEYAHRFGFGRKTGILLSGESSGIARNTNKAVDFSRASFGYAVNVTPLQLATAYCALAHDGRLLKPQIIHSLVANDGTLIQTYPPEVVGEVVKPAVARQMRTALEKVTQKGGTATAAAVPGFRVAGKTGTAKRIAPRGRGYLNNSYTVSFVGMMPADDPAFVCVVVIDDPKTDKVKRYGGTIAAPTFAKIATRLAGRLNLQPTEPVPDNPLAQSKP
jgi:cell division protein FtsI/penicillin-binding protein 2